MYVINKLSYVQRFRVGLVRYTQVTLSMGYLGLLHDVIAILRCVLVNPTYGSIMYYQSPAAQNKEGFYGAPAADVPDRKRLRSQCRKMMGALQMQLFIGGIVLAAYGNSLYSQDFDDQHKADVTAVLRQVF
ncbi:hypothetical protein JR316_0002621 [Psilocybe cubensis]|uniref:Uncharacterized protein n=2 Tax=Psilocybe cubensis TaxID=181762 RepID=A0ACB8HCQ8_PSICU|nr:hypothetical protein JR316_0002621 [Psilocybe cubensis]KAH9485708.1 hypothetical protein JR316_0002621 [Psilocybe cubensis]